MRKRIAALLVFGWLLSAGAAWAESPVSVSHTMTGYTMGTDTVTLTYNLTVKNTSAGSISNVTLAHVPLFLFSRDEIVLNIAMLDPQAEALIPFTVMTPMLLSESEFRHQALFWAGSCTDSTGSLIEFPAKSLEGGVF